MLRVIGGLGVLAARRLCLLLLFAIVFGRLCVADGFSYFFVRG